ncbi:Small RNA degrading nuclease 5 [Diplonema papillatum]|nr:Small RNA degrading nuclease 5 [Diplonema papillatum]
MDTGAASVSDEVMAKTLGGGAMMRKKKRPRPGDDDGKKKKQKPNDPPLAPTPAPPAGAPRAPDGSLDAPPKLSLKLLEAKKVWLTLKDVQGLVLWILGQELPPRWAFLERAHLIPHVMVVALNSLSLPVWTQHGSNAMPFLSSLLDPVAADPLSPSPNHTPFYHVPTRLHTSTRDMRKDAFLAEFFKKEGRKKKQQPPPQLQPQGTAAVLAGHLKATADAAEKKPEEDKQQPAAAPSAPTVPAEAKPQPGKSPAKPAGGEAGAGAPAVGGRPAVAIPDICAQRAFEMLADFVASEDQLQEHGFMLTRIGDAFEADYVSTVPAAELNRELTDRERIVCLDCEMCLTKNGHELTRISLVDWKGAVLYDELVRPEAEITDYLTQFSGITPAMLTNVTTRLRDVQNHLLTNNIFSETLILGHSLENDMKALRLIHTNIVDTTILYPHFQGPPYKSALRYLTNKYLNRSVQGARNASGGVVPGHDSVQDAIAALDLVKLKLAGGPAFGVPGKQQTEPVLKLIQGRSCVVDNIYSIRKIPLKGCSCDAVPVMNDADAVKKAAKSSVKGKFCFVHLHELEGYFDAIEWDEDHEAADDTVLKKILAGLDESVKQLYHAAPPDTLFCFLSGQSNGVAGGDQVDTDPEALLKGWDNARQGTLFIGLKQSKPPRET